MDIIKELLIGPWPDMRFIVGETNPKYGRCIEIDQTWNVTKQIFESGDWRDCELKAAYSVVCSKDGVTKTIYFNQDNPDLVVVIQE